MGNWHESHNSFNPKGTIAYTISDPLDGVGYQDGLSAKALPYCRAGQQVCATSSTADIQKLCRSNI